MKHPVKSTRAFTLAELLVATLVFGIMSGGLVLYTSSALRMVARNFATNHSHETVRGSLERMFHEVHDSASRFQLMTFDGVKYTDVTATVTGDKDAYTQQYISNRANGVRFLRQAGIPYKITGNGSSTSIAATDITLECDFSGGTYQPAVGDVVQIPVVSREFQIITPAPVKTTGNKWKVTLNSSIGFSLITVSGSTGSGITWTNPVSTALFFQRVGYTVWNGQLRYHPYLTDPPYPATVAANDAPTLVRGNVTSPKPFALLFPTSSSTLSDGLNLRVSLESYDTPNSARLFQNATSTLQSVIPSRNQPPILSTN